jgi:hypothetical protein
MIIISTKQTGKESALTPGALLKGHPGFSNKENKIQREKVDKRFGINPSSSGIRWLYSSRKTAPTSALGNVCH